MPSGGEDYLGQGRRESRVKNGDYNLVIFPYFLKNNTHV